jgi:uncharacterized membrane protein YcaP (DUF421 family)
MDPFRIGIRAALAYIFLLALLRLAGKATIYQGTPFDFVLALVLGDIVDDALWSEVPMAQFVVAATSLVLMKLAVSFRTRYAVARGRVGRAADRRRRST